MRRGGWMCVCEGAGPHSTAPAMGWVTIPGSSSFAPGLSTVDFLLRGTQTPFPNHPENFKMRHSLFMEAPGVGVKSQQSPRNIPSITSTPTLMPWRGYLNRRPDKLKRIKAGIY